jgi:hypothetical protein
MKFIFLGNGARLLKPLTSRRTAVAFGSSEAAGYRRRVMGGTEANVAERPKADAHRT